MTDSSWSTSRMYIEIHYTHAPTPPNVPRVLKAILNLLKSEASVQKFPAENEKETLLGWQNEGA